MKNTKIEWTHHTFNPWIGCTKVSPGCAHCYAETLNKRMGWTEWGDKGERHRTSAANWNEPLRWQREAEKTGQRFRVFCASLADWLDKKAPVEWLADLLTLIQRTPNLDWLLLTKRPENWQPRMEAVLHYLSRHDSLAERTGGLYVFIANWIGVMGGPQRFRPGNIWIGTSVEDQQRADERIPALLKIPARVRFLSCEPLLGPVDFGWDSLQNGWQASEIHWVIAGGESGPGARPMHPDWPRGLRDQCQAAGVAFLFKQWGEWAPCPIGDGPDLVTDAVFAKGPGHDGEVWRVGKKPAGRLLDGREWNEFPQEGGVA
jgi:protein gp37